MSRQVVATIWRCASSLMNEYNDLCMYKRFVLICSKFMVVWRHMDGILDLNTRFAVNDMSRPMASFLQYNCCTIAFVPERLLLRSCRVIHRQTWRSPYTLQQAICIMS